jgi:uncharacterized protein with PIN domain
MGLRMAIEVISRKHPSATKVVVCRNCGAELRYTESDTKKKTVTDYTGSKDIYKIIECPECSGSIYVS